ncbi:MAG: hypothetical protein D3903_11110 [Candidatus Electrothrix sp. GM3_4]|nr:hypothetical protein [Candidatus Electrothrix sp. GM3_4]
MKKRLRTIVIAALTLAVGTGWVTLGHSKKGETIGAGDDITFEAGEVKEITRSCSKKHHTAIGMDWEAINITAYGEFTLSLVGSTQGENRGDWTITLHNRSHEEHTYRVEATSICLPHNRRGSK